MTASSTPQPTRAEFLRPLVAAVHQQFGVTPEVHRDGSVTFTNAHGTFQVDGWYVDGRITVHGGFADDSVAAPGRPHWLLQAGGDGFAAYTGWTCDLQSALDVAAQTLAPEPDPSGPLTIDPTPGLAALDRRRPLDTRAFTLDAHLDDDIRSGLRPADQARLNDDLDSLDLALCLASLPRDSTGGLATASRVVLDAFGPPTNSRRPVLMLWTATAKRNLGVLRVGLAREFAVNHQDNWAGFRGLWSRAPGYGKSPATGCSEAAAGRAQVEVQSTSELLDVEQAIRHLNEGALDKAYAPFGVKVGVPLRRLLAGRPAWRFDRYDPRWLPIAQETCLLLAPWKIADAITQESTRLRETVKHPSRSWSQRLVLLPHQRHQMKLTIVLRTNPKPTPGHIADIDVESTGSNQYVPRPAWSR